MKGYAYLDKYGILHAVQAKATAESSARNGKVVETEFCGGTGYMEENDETPFIYSDEKEFYRDGNAKRGTKITEEKFKSIYPNTYEVYKKLI